jgi:hypothetical protein
MQPTGLNMSMSYETYIPGWYLQRFVKKNSGIDERWRYEWKHICFLTLTLVTFNYMALTKLIKLLSLGFFTWNIVNMRIYVKRLKKSSF